MNNKVLGFVGQINQGAAWNKGFDKEPRRFDDGTFYITSYSTGYSTNIFGNQNGEKIFNLSSMDENGKANSIDKRFKNLTGKDVKSLTALEIEKELDQFPDVKIKGIVFAPKKGEKNDDKGCKTVSILGVAHLETGLNVYKDTQSVTIDILCQFQPDENKANETLGTQTILDKAFFIQPFSFNPLNRKDEIENGRLSPITKDDYNLFKQKMLQSVSNLDTAQKAGCYNSISFFVELEEGQSMAKPNFAKIIKVTEENDMFVCDINKLKVLANDDRIKSIELYYDTTIVSLANNPFTDKSKIKYFDLVSQKEWDIVKNDFKESEIK